MAFSMYTTIPISNVKWDEKNFPYIIVSLPFVGFIIGLIWFLTASIFTILSIPHSIKTIIICLIPLFLSGCIHIDGYMDTCDAIFSRASLEKKYKILKDSHVGAFAVIGILILAFLAYFSIYEILEFEKNLVSLIFIPIFSRGVTSLFIIKTNATSKEGFIASFKRNLDNNHFFIILLILIVFFTLGYFLGVAKIIIIDIIACIIFARFCIKNLNGISGDLCGFIITTGSITAIVFLAIL
ncbi:adenosylcobinamide-GDP ribazoletransferase [uncultured Tyzzerella sp.]|uniref:adenosylcobinamide-GDP ribazoletransferase n=1 Tax=uncultured Tyzzerella sp. TaxID=2321398 RepID=UPI0029424A47|nr:adenosylcobinamide-GDP ribazoletransferase [uncultured Tyzzerella sp.]